MLDHVTISSRFCGPPDSGNGGYVCGLVASQLDGVAEVTLRVPPPLETPLTFVRGDNGTIELRDGEVVVASGVSAELDTAPPAAPTLAQAREAAKEYPHFNDHVFPTCFVCGPRRAPHDGLCIFPGEVDGGACVAAPWTPHPSLADDTGVIRPEILWAALDCPGGIAWNVPQGATPSVLGRMAARLLRLPAAGQQCVAVGWKLERDGRKLFAGTAVFTESGELCGISRQTWIRLKPET